MDCMIVGGEDRVGRVDLMAALLLTAVGEQGSCDTPLLCNVMLGDRCGELLRAWRKFCGTFVRLTGIMMWLVINLFVFI